MGNYQEHYSSLDVYNSELTGAYQLIIWLLLLAFKVHLIFHVDCERTAIQRLR